jgi:thiol-disulfide isomerase/thioredoxin
MAQEAYGGSRIGVGAAMAVAGMTVLLLLALGGLAAGPSGGADGSVRFPELGSGVPDFHLPALLDEDPWIGGDSVRLSDFRGRWVYLDVFGSWCLPCQLKYPTMLRVAREFRDGGGVVLGVLLEDRPAVAGRWLRDHGGIEYPFAVLDEETRLLWQITGAPMGFLISPEGQLERLCYGCSRGVDAVERLPEVLR